MRSFDDYILEVFRVSKFSNIQIVHVLYSLGFSTTTYQTEMDYRDFLTLDLLTFQMMRRID